MHDRESIYPVPGTVRVPNDFFLDHIKKETPQEC